VVSKAECVSTSQEINPYVIFTLHDNKTATSAYCITLLSYLKESIQHWVICANKNHSLIINHSNMEMKTAGHDRRWRMDTTEEFNVN